MRRVLTTKFPRLIADRLQTVPRKRLADEIGITPQKLDDMLHDRWHHPSRDAFEKLAGHFNLSSSDIFEFAPSEFWHGIESAKECYCLRGSDSSRFPPKDQAAVSRLADYLNDALQMEMTFAYVPEEKNILEYADLHNCIVVGSPRSNRATEVLLSRFFGAEPFNGTTENRQKIPFGFCWPTDDEFARQSSLTCSAPARKEMNEKVGIALKGALIPADYRPPKDFRQWGTQDGRDCALVFVANRQLKNQTLKLIVLAGLSGIGTIAAAHALVSDFTDLEPLPNEPCVYGVIEARYSKPQHSADGRDYREFFWRYRKGGRSPKAIKPAKLPKARTRAAKG